MKSAPELAKEVDRLNSVINGGRGCGVLGNVLAVLRRGDVEAAIRIIRLDSDKLHQYNADTGCFAILQGLGLWRPEWPQDPSSPSPFDLLRVEAIKKFLEENPKEAGPVFDQVMGYLAQGYEDQARYKLRLDADKFHNKQRVVQFLAQADLLDPEYREILIRSGEITA